LVTGRHCTGPPSPQGYCGCGPGWCPRPTGSAWARSRTSTGTQPEAIDLAEERGAFGRELAEAGLPEPKHGTAFSFQEAKAIADEIGYPVLARPSYVLGGRGMLRELAALGFELLATSGTAEVLRRNGIDATVVPTHSDGEGVSTPSSS
jgi:hypothetical protein